MLTNIMTGAMVVMAIALWWLYNENDTLKANNATLKTSFATQKAAANALKDRITEFDKTLEDFSATTDRLLVASENAGKQLKKMNDVFAKHDLQKLLDKKPGLVIKSVNNGIADLDDKFVCATSPSGCEAD